MAASDILLSPGTGYGMLIGLAIAFALIILAAVRFQRRYLLEETNHSEMFMVANRSVGIGLTASAVFSSWVWIDETVYACTFAYWWGVAAPVCGMHPVSAAFLIPLGVTLYTAVGGLKATFLTDFSHTTIALILLIYFTVSILTNEHIGGIGGLYDKVKAFDIQIDGNYKGSSKLQVSQYNYLGRCFANRQSCDTAFWQKSFASEVSATVPGYNLAFIAIIAVPWAVSTALKNICQVYNAFLILKLVFLQSYTIGVLSLYVL
ncbi:hypothetical protein B7463_g2497, partial [Scytalidium lignicola]